MLPSNDSPADGRKLVSFTYCIASTCHLTNFLPACCAFSCQDWRLEPVYRMEKMVDGMYVTEWDYSGPYRPINCCTCQCIHAVCCTASSEGELVSMGCDCCIEEEEDEEYAMRINLHPSWRNDEHNIRVRGVVAAQPSFSADMDIDPSKQPSPAFSFLREQDLKQAATGSLGLGAL